MESVTKNITRVHRLEPSCGCFLISLHLFESYANSLVSFAQVFLKTLTGRTLALDVEPSELVQNVKGRILDIEGIPLEHQRLLFAGKHLEDSLTLHEQSIEKESELYLAVALRGGGKKKKKKTKFTKPKVIKHKHVTVKLAALKFYKVDENGQLTRLNKECPSGTCPGGVFMAKHHDRYTCGRCAMTYVHNKE